MSRARWQDMTSGEDYGAAIRPAGTKDVNIVKVPGTADRMPARTEGSFNPPKGSFSKPKSLGQHLKGLFESDKEKRRKAKARQSLEKETWM